MSLNTRTSLFIINSFTIYFPIWIFLVLIPKFLFVIYFVKEISKLQGSICSANSDSESFHSHSGYDELELLKLYHSYLQGDMKNATYNKVLWPSDARR